MNKVFFGDCRDTMRDLIRAADRARVKRLPVGIVRATNQAILRCFDALSPRKAKGRK